MNVGDKRIIELEAQVDILDELTCNMQHVTPPGTKAFPQSNATVTGLAIKEVCIEVVHLLRDATSQELARELSEKDQAAKDDRDDMKMEEERGG